MAKDFTKFAKKTNDGATNTRSLSELGNNAMYDIKAPFRGSLNEKKVENIEIHKLVPFKGETPFHDYIGKEKFHTLVRDIEENGILTPIIVRALSDGTYEVLAGRHRSEAAKYLHLATVPAIVYPVDTSDTKAMMIHLNTNLLNGREEMSFVEKVRAMVAYEATLEKQKGKRSDRQDNGEKYDRYQQLAEVFKIGNKTTAVKQLKAGKEMPEDILLLVDAGHVSFDVAYKMMVQSDELFREELYAFLRQGNKVTMSQLDSLIEEYQRKKKNPATETPAEEQAADMVENTPAESGSAFDGFQSIEDVDFEMQDKTPVVVEEQKEENQETEAKIEGNKPVLNANDFENIINGGKKKKTCTFKIDKEQLPERFVKLDDDKKTDLIIDLLKQWDETLDN